MSADTRQLRIGVVGGIFGAPAEYRKRVQFTPETVLVRGLRERGHHVDPISHFDRFDPDQYDIVHVHHLSWGAMRMAGSASTTPFVFTLHQTSPERRRAAKFVMARADAVVGLWPADAEQSRRDYALDDAIVRAIPNGIDHNTFRFEMPKPPADHEPWRIHFVGQLLPMKAVDVLLDAVAELRATAELEVCLSYHTASEETALRSQAKALGIDDIVRFLGAAAQAELAERYLASHIVVLPSRPIRQGEALPSALTEAMLCGRYPVATDVGGIRDQLGPYGIVVPESSPQRLAEGLTAAFDTYDAHCDRAAAMRDYAVGRFSIDQMIAGHEDLYRTLVTQGRTPRRLAGARTLGTVTARRLLDLRMRKRHAQAS